jgi:mycofactocin precursor
VVRSGLLNFFSPDHLEDAVNDEAAEANPSISDASGSEATTEAAPERLVQETLVEEVSIDGMCGVY